MPVSRKDHPAQLFATPCSRTGLVTRVGVSVLKVVQIGRLAVQHLAEHAGVHQTVHQHLVVAVVAVLELQAVALVALGGIDKRPEILERDACGAFSGCVLAGRAA